MTEISRNCSLPSGKTTNYVWVRQCLQDVRFAFRHMIRNWPVTLVALLSLMLGIGANTAIFSFVESILFRPLPVPQSKSLVVMKWKSKNFASPAKSFTMSTAGTHKDPRGGTIGTVFPYPALELFQKQQDLFVCVFAYFREHHNVTVQGRTESLLGDYVSGSYFRGMGSLPFGGRLISDQDDRAGAPPVAVLSHRLSVRLFAQPSEAIGQTIHINRKLFTVIGIASRDFFGAEPGTVPDLYLPMHSKLILDPDPGTFQKFLDKNDYWIEIMARLKKGVNIAKAEVVLAPQFRHLMDQSASSESDRSDLPRLMVAEGAYGLDSLKLQYSKSLVVLMAMAGFILLIACANIANMLLSQAIRRKQELALRVSLGSSRGRIIRQLMTENLLLAFIGGILGIGLAAYGMKLISVLLTSGRQNVSLHAELNVQVLGATLALSLCTGFLFGLLPALRATRVDLTPALKDIDSSYISTPRINRSPITAWRTLVVVQITLSFLLVLGAGLFGYSLSKLYSSNIGFNYENVLVFSTRVQGSGLDPQAIQRRFSDLQEQLSAIPGIVHVSLSSRAFPMDGGTKAPVAIVGMQQASSAPNKHGSMPRAGLANIGAGFFRTLQIPLLAGREFAPGDDVRAPRVVIVNRAFVESFGLTDALAHSVRLGNSQYRIVGVVRDAVYTSIREDRVPIMYLALKQNHVQFMEMTYQVRTAGNPLNYSRLVKQVVQQIDPFMSVTDMKTQKQHIDQTIIQEIMLAKLCLWFASLALLIACIGVYGVVRQSVTQRMSEIGIRIAIGAKPAGILSLLMREVVALIVASLAISVPIVYILAEFIGALLFGIEPSDPGAIVVASIVLISACLLAGFVPAHRVCRLSPVAIIRQNR